MIDHVAGRPPLDRRRFLELVAIGGGAALALPLLDQLPGGRGPLPAEAIPAPALPPGYTPSFPDGVMAGDPAADGSTIWTRLSAPTPAAGLDLLWEVATDDTFASIVAGGTVGTDASRDYTVKVPVTGLAADSWFHYRFTAGTLTSPVGRLRTAPAPGSSPDRLRFGFCADQQRSSPYVAQRNLAAEPDLDFVVHLGDYLYVSDGGTTTLDDYRGVHHLFKSDPLLQELQAAYPMVVIWDDGEFRNGVDRTEDPTRLASAIQAWMENMPLVPPAGDPTRIFRSIQWGDLAELAMIDVTTRKDPVVGTDTTAPDGAPILDPDRSVLGAPQRQWLLDTLLGTTAVWRVLGSGWPMGTWKLRDDDPGPPRPAGTQVNGGQYASTDLWDNFVPERRAILEQLAAAGRDDLVVVSGQTHFAAAYVLRTDPDDPTLPVVGYDFTCASLTADPSPYDQFPGRPRPEVDALFHGLEAASRELNPDQPFVDLLHFGYCIVELTRDRLTVEYKLVDVEDLDATATLALRITIGRGDGFMRLERFDPTAGAAEIPSVWPVVAADGGPDRPPTTTAPAAIDGIPRFTG